MAQFRKGVLTMRNHLKKFLVVLCIMTCAMGLTACGNAAKDDAITYDSSNVQSISEFMVNSVLVTMNDEQLTKFQELDPVDIEKMFSEQVGFEVDGTAFLAGLTSWQSAQTDLGEFGQITGTTVEADSEMITADVAISGSKHNAIVELTFDKRLKVTSCATNVTYSFGESMEKAALNTLLGMGTVFVVLILISLIISCFAFIPKIEASMKKKKEAKKAAESSPVDQTIAQIIEKEEATDDLELIAVISAAIAAYESSNGNSGDGYVVRSIRRRY